MQLHAHVLSSRATRRREQLDDMILATRIGMSNTEWPFVTLRPPQPERPSSPAKPPAPGDEWWPGKVEVKLGPKGFSMKRAAPPGSR